MSPPYGARTAARAGSTTYHLKEESTHEQARLPILPDDPAAERHGRFRSVQKAGKINGKPAPDKIYSYRTMESYKDTARHFCDWLRAEHPDVKTLKTARDYAAEYIAHLTTATVPEGRKNAGGGYSAWTINTRAAGLRKALGLSPDQLPAPSRNRENVTQNRDLSWARAHFDPSANADLVTVCRGTGLRRSELAALRPEQVQDIGGGAAAIEGVRGKVAGCGASRCCLGMLTVSWNWPTRPRPRAVTGYSAISPGCTHPRIPGTIRP